MTTAFSARGLVFWLAISLLLHLPLGAIVLERWEGQGAGDARPFTIHLADQKTRASGGNTPTSPVRTDLSTTHISEARPPTTALFPLPVASLSIDPIPAPVTLTSPEEVPLTADIATGTPAVTADPTETPIVVNEGGAGSVSEDPGSSAPGELGSSASSDTSGVYTPPLYAERADPLYPPQARKNGEEGEVSLTLQIAADGTVGLITIEHSSGYEDLDRAATLTVQRWRFHPARRNGVPIEERVRLTLIFRLQPADRPVTTD